MFIIHSHNKIRHTQYGCRCNQRLKVQTLIFVYYEEIKRELQRILIYECGCNERQNAKAEGFIHLEYTGLSGGLENLKVETRLRDGRFESV